MSNYIIKKNDKPELRMPTFTVDNELHKKLNEYELTKILNKPHFILILGKAGSGKSSLEISLLQTPTLFKKVWHTIILFCPKNSRASIKSNFWEKNLVEQQIYDDLNIENLRNAYDVAETNAKEGLQTLVIMDDVQKNLRDLEVQKFLLHMVNNRRHARLCIHLLCQNYFTIPLLIRDALTNLFVFKVSKKEMEKIFDETIERAHEDFNTILKTSYTKKHDFLFIDTFTKRLFYNWDEIIEKDDGSVNNIDV